MDSTSWETWWQLNRDLFIDARAQLDPQSRTTLSDELARLAARSARPDAAQVVSIAAPALMRVLHEESNPEILRSCLIALARIDGPTEGALAQWDQDLDEVLASFLAHQQLQVSEAAALALGIRGREAGARILESVVIDNELGRERVARHSVPERTRAFAAFGLGLCARRAESEDLRRWIVHALVAANGAVRGSSRDLQGAVVAALGLARLDPYSAYFDRVVSFKRDLLNAGERMPATAAAVALVADMFTLLADEKRPTEARAQIPTAIANVIQGAEETLRAECVREFVRILKSGVKQREITAGVMLALGTIVLPLDTPHDRTARALLADTARVGERSARGFALISAGRIGRAAWRSEERAGALEMEELLLEALTRGKSGAPGWAAIGLGILGDAHGLLDVQRGNAALRAVFASDRNQSDSGAAALALGMRRDLQVKEALRERVLATGADEVRGRYALALGLMLDCDAGTTLRELVAGTANRPTLLREIVTSLALLGDASLTEELVRALAEAPTQADKAAFAEALALVGDARSLSPLAELATAEKVSLGVRTHAVRALGSVADLDPLPWNAPFAFNAQYLAAADVLLSRSGGSVLDPR
ncbi:MAG: hypothetical protein JNL28_02520 [Planctomycetes bacterium]|nr:hypothetical protein [Planctomycetota bacterium]